MALDLVDRDLKYVWHPCSQMKDYEIFKPLKVVGASGAEICLHGGQRIIDAISSWWCKSLGHQHPRLKKALINQIEKFEHVILANTTNDTIVALSEQLAQLTHSLNKVFYANDGSCAVEIAMKMSLHARQITGQINKKQFIALRNGYHGETVGALSISDIGIYRTPYESMLFTTHFLSPLPYVQSEQDPLWHDCENYWVKIERELEEKTETATAILVEPIVQGAGGMRIYSQDFLRRLRMWTQANDVHLIADEIMTGMGRTGKMLACHHANIEPDFLCLSKGLTSGWLPLSVVLTREDIYELFYADYETGKSFLHSHTYSGNALAASVALEVLKIFSEDDICQRAREIGQIMYRFLVDIANTTRRLKNVRGIGAIVAADLIDDDLGSRTSFAIYQKAVELGALLRPLGNTIYWLPPLNINEGMLTQLKYITEQAILKVVKERKKR
jgi:adenosylmethionine-8-amino-7-oxononanoate aminotransferase